jgi:hypothetical protein
MTKDVARDPSNFDFGYRPASYFEGLAPQTVIVASILGEERRKDVLERLATGDYDPLVWGEWITESKLDDATRQLIGSCHPMFMGGEYLPTLEQDEIEIARIVCASVTQDVTSIRARRRGKRIYYRVVNEHEFEFEISRTWSAQPLSLEELIRLIDQSNIARDTMANGLVFSILDWNLDASGEIEPMREFITVSSDFYPELGLYFDEAIDSYLDGKEKVPEEDEEYEEEEEEVDHART